MTEISREIGEIWSRIFDHRPVINGEIKFMLREFEEKRLDREVENLFGVLEKLTDIKDTHAPRINLLADVGLKSTSDKLESALAFCEDIATDLETLCKIKSKKLEERRAQRAVEWEQFVTDMIFKCKRIDNAFEEKEEELKDFYADLDHKLNITN